VQEKIEKFSQYPDFVRFFFEDVSPDGADPEMSRLAHDRLAAVEHWDAATIEQALRGLVEELGQKPRQAFQPIRLAVTGSKVSPGLFESLELLGRERSLARLSAAAS
jgi:glutamyl-tRNA synthetase